jgi:hypothetical protein
VATLTRTGHIDQTLLWRDSGDRIRLWWAILEPFVRRMRDEDRQPNVLTDFEWLAGVIAALGRKAGTAIVVDNTFIAHLRDRLITSYHVSAPARAGAPDRHDRVA